MVKSTFISIGLHVFFILAAYYGLPSFKVKEPLEQPIDIVEDTVVSSKTVLKLGKPNKEFKKIKKGSKEFLKKLDNEKSNMNIQRFKGLGEMNPEELWSTTLNPETRNLLQVKYSKDLKKDQNLIHTLMGNDVALRKDFIISNAINVQNLDI